MPRCQAKQYLMRGIRPSPQTKMNFAVCTRKCIFCDIWRLAGLISHHVPLSVRYSTTTQHLQSLSSNPSHDYARSERLIQARMAAERSRVTSIMSICTMEGAEESDGLHLAYRRSLKAVQELLYEEAILEEDLVRAPTPEYDPYYLAERRRPSLVSMTA